MFLSNMPLLLSLDHGGEMCFFKKLESLTFPGDLMPAFGAEQDAFWLSGCLILALVHFCFYRNL